MVPMSTRFPRRLRLVLALSLAATLVAPGASASGSPPGHRSPDGLITFMREDDAGRWQTWVARADLSRQRQLTSGAANSGWPVLAPDRPLIAFDSDRSDTDPADDVGVNDVFVVRPNGTGLRRVTDSVGVSSDPGWSPDGRSLAIAADRGDYPAAQGIYILRSDGTRLRRVTVLPEGSGLDTAPRFSPSGRHLVFTRYQWVDDRELGALFVVRTDGTRERQLTPFALNAGDATWSPDGRTLTFEAYPDPASRGDVYTVRSDGTKVRNLTRNDARFAGSADPVWSPDGRRILFLDSTRADEDAEFSLGLAVMTPRGTQRRFLSDGAEHQPDWQSSSRHRGGKGWRR
jgi:Tol biopolymer transport system component